MIYFAPTILVDTGMSISPALTATIIVGVSHVVVTIISVLLLDRLGRRELLLTGNSGLLLAVVVLGTYFTSSTIQERSVGLRSAPVLCCSLPRRHRPGTGLLADALRDQRPTPSRRSSPNSSTMPSKPLRHPWRPHTPQSNRGYAHALDFQLCRTMDPTAPCCAP